MSSTALEAALTEDPESVNLFLHSITIGAVGALSIQKHLLTNPQVRVLELKGSVLGRQGASYLSKGIAASQLSHLGLGRNSLDFASAMTLLKALIGTPIETLDMEWNALQDGVAQGIADLLATTSTLRSLTLERNDFRSEGVVTIAKALLANRTLQNLNLAFNRCGTAACEALGDVLEVNPTLLTLNLMQCSVTTEAARHLVRGLAKNRTLVSINLQANQALDAFSGRSAGGTTTYPVALSAALREVNLGSNRISSAFVPNFASVLKEATSVVALSLGKCLFGEPAVQEVLRSVARLTRLVTVDLSGCLISSASGELLSEVLTRCPNIASLFLDDNPLGRFGVEGLSTGVPFAASLTCLSLCRVDMGREGMIPLAAALRDRVGVPLREMRLVGNHLSYDGCLTLCDALVNMRNDAAKDLEVLDISDNDIGGRSCAFLAAVLQAHRNSLLSITLRGNPISEETKSNFLTFESALNFTGGIISDPTMKLGQHGNGTKGTFEMEKRHQGASPTASPSSNRATHGNARQSFSNFNGTSAAGQSRLESEVSPSRRQSVAAIAVDAAAASAGDATAATSLPTGIAYEPGLAPIVPQFKQRHQLHDVAENINCLPITDTQLRAKFNELDVSCVGYINVPTLFKAYAELDPVMLEVTTRRLKERTLAVCPDGMVTYPRFCVLMLQLVNQ